MAEESTPQTLFGVLTVAPQFINMPVPVRADASLSAIRIPPQPAGVACRGAVQLATGAVAATITITLFRGPSGSGGTPFDCTLSIPVAVGVGFSIPFDFVDTTPNQGTTPFAGEYSLSVSSSILQTGNSIVAARFMSW